MEMQLVQALVLFVAAVLGGALNSVAGGGSFFTVPMLIFTGMPSITANVTSTVALWPGSAASVAAYRNELRAQRRLVPLLGGISLVGGVLGAILLLYTSQATFDNLFPYLLLIATLLFAFSPQITGVLRARFGASTDVSQRSPVGIALLQFVIAIYGGYFGGGIGILMLAALALMGLQNIHEMNGLKTLLATFINGVAVLTFVLANAVAWPQAVLMVVGAIVGGYGGAAYARRLDPRVVRTFVIVVSVALTAYFFLRG
jgi:uncharacterized membrane protein YfcA